MAKVDINEDDQNKVKLLLPHLALAFVCLAFLAVNFWCYRRNNYERYKRKMEKLAQDMMSMTPRRVTSMARYSDPTGTVNPDNGAYDVNSNSTGTTYDIFSSNGSPSEERQENELLARSDTPDCIDASSTPAFTDKRDANQDSSGDSRRRPEISSLPPVKMPLGLFSSSAAASGKNNRLPAL